MITITHQAQRATDNFTQVYDFTLNKLFPNGNPSNDPLILLRLLADDDTHQAVHALELWLFCEARKICLNVKDTEHQRENIQKNIIQRFIAQSDTELSAEKMTQAQELTQAILQKMGFQLH